VFPYDFAYPYLGYPYYYFYGPPTLPVAPPPVETERLPSTDAQVTANAGGLSFEITPSHAQVYVDGTYVGLASNFGPQSLPLTLKAGTHHVELRAARYQTLAFDADVVAGQVMPYQGTLQAQP
jgi:hypothetical protein